LAIHHGWKTVGLTVGCASLTLIPLIYFFLKESPQSIGSSPYGSASDWTAPVIPKRNAAKEAINSLREASKKRDFWYLTLSFLVCGLSTSGLVGTHFIPASHDHGMSEVTAASLLALIGVFDVVGTILSGYLTDRIDPRKLLFFYYFFRGLSLFLLPSILLSSLHASTLVFIIFYGLDWVATVPPTIVLCRTVLGPDRATVVYGWVFAAHQIGGSIAALGAAILRVKFGNYAVAFYAAGILCLGASYIVLQIGKGISAKDPARA
jgi:predicted MFS family arabinose efflux permease